MTLLPQTFRPLHVRMRVASLSRSREFYAGVLGFHATAEGAHELALRATEHSAPLITLLEDPAASPKPARAAGLFHLAILLPDRPSLAATLGRLVASRWPVQGMSDHGVSEALYLADPDGNGLELYCDRPRHVWPRRNGELSMQTLPLDLEDLWAQLATAPASGLPPETCIGHIHLSVTSLAKSEAFYTGELGLTVTQRSYPGVIFFAADGYHHHLAVNTWGHINQPSPPHAAGLLEMTFMQTEASPRTLVDPDGNHIIVQPAAVSRHESAPARS